MSHLSTAEIHEKTNRGSAERYRTKLREGVERVDRIRFGKNYARMQGLCVGCENFDLQKTQTVDGSHCKLPKDKHCLK